MSEEIVLSALSDGEKTWNQLLELVDTRYHQFVLPTVSALVRAGKVTRSLEKLPDGNFELKISKVG